MLVKRAIKKIISLFIVSFIFICMFPTNVFAMDAVSTEIAIPIQIQTEPVYSITINTATEQLVVYDEQNLPVKVFSCSTGLKGNTYLGTYKTSDYYDWRALYGGVWGRYAVRFNGSELMHSVPYFKKSVDSLEYEEYNKLGTPASAGCCRLAVADAKWIYENTKSGTVVNVIYDPNIVYELTRPNILIDVNNIAIRGWDPTDTDINSPYNQIIK